MKRPIEWHEECLANHRIHVERERKAVADAVASLKRSEERLAFDEAQLAEAKRRGLTEFDDERLMVNRKAAPKQEG